MLNRRWCPSPLKTNRHCGACWSLILYAALSAVPGAGIAAKDGGESM